ncbi:MULTISPECIES: dihydrofolate reductase family protein [unclassified Cellulomonas]|uniref:dihydrofolate reductase family protein n=1 Tax=unclassified Cellulomonas TaxID=2620175 RepID=UPI00198EAF79|nr:dihydrofolate reductase family protein [Cellulomonas sp. ES6]MBD3779577.1 dihydrofolate reductase [Micrococcales bacterium]WHP18798.1 dihydrofolate reductase family protein [Cellulomonas sp. ES6]
MRTIYNTATTLNGYIADERNSLDWLFAVDDSVAPDQEAFLAGVTVLVLGSTTYEWVVEHEDLVAHPERWPGYFGRRPLFVFTTRELPVPEGVDVRFVRGPVAQVLPRIREAAGDGDAWLVGGGDLAGQLLDAGALDEVQLSVAPAALTGGAPVLPRTVGADRLRLRTVEQFGQFAHLTYDVVPVG